MATFSIVSGDDPSRGELIVATAYGSETSLQSVLDDSRAWQIADSERSKMETAMKHALAARGSYPLSAGRTMRNSIGWAEGLRGILLSKPSAIKLTMGSETWPLLPEVIPLVLDDPVDFQPDAIRWLDQIAPIYRTLNHISKPVAQRVDEKSLAIVYQVEKSKVFSRMAENIQRRLSGGQLIVDARSGAEFVNDPASSFVDEIIHKYRAVLFLGHSHRPERRLGGWHLTEDTWLSMRQLKDLLNSNQRPYQTSPIPEVIFASCCCGALRDPGTLSSPGLCYPELFLDAGVRFFIGTWMDVVIPGDSYKQDIEILETLLSNFFSQWAANPDRSVEHLWDSKKKCDFHLLTSLFQIYSSAGEAPTKSEDRQPVGALVSGLSVGDRAGDYILTSELWADTYARTFWARSETNESNHIVQVLVDEWQDKPELGAELNGAINKLKEVGLGQGHLIPSRHELVMWFHQQQQQRRLLHILVYDRNAHETAEDWSTLDSRPFDRNSANHFMDVLRLGAQASLLLSELHARGIVHGNFDPGSIVFLKVQGIDHVLIKDAWVRRTRPGRYTDSRYAAPEELGQQEGADQLKYDCWGLGVILFELTTGHSPFEGNTSPKQGLGYALKDLMGPLQYQIPQALDRVVRECLVPAASLRPSADLVASRLLFALNVGGIYASQLEKDLSDYIRAGHRLFSITVDEMDDFMTTLDSFTAQQYQGVRYRLYVATENTGVIERRSGYVLLPWIDARAVHALVVEQTRRHNLPDPGMPSADYVAAINAQAMLEWAAFSSPSSSGEQPILLIRGASWWDASPAEFRLAAWRMLKFCQEERRSPIIIIADNFIEMDTELSRSFVELTFPPASTAELFERILAFPNAEPLGLPSVSADTAIDLAHQFYPCASRGLTDGLRLCALKYGVIDLRALEIRDEEREQYFKMFGTLSFIPASKLPPPEVIGLPHATEKVLSLWAQTVSSASEHMPASSSRRRVMISGAEGCGKSTLALTLAKRLNFPVVRIDATRCLRGGLGESESVLRHALQSVNSLEAALVLLDDIDRFFDGSDASNDSSALFATMTRMSGILLDWLDLMPANFIAILTAVRPDTLPAQWRRRIQMEVPLEVPTSQGSLSSDDFVYRSNVFAAVFRKCGLHDLAADPSLMHALARQTDPYQGLASLRSPGARKAKSPLIRNHTVRLNTGADIENWIQETIILHTSADYAPDQPDFWRDALERVY